TFSPVPKSARCLAPSSRTRSTRGGASAVSPIRTSSSRRARGRGRWPGMCWTPDRRVCRRSGTYSSSAPRVCAMYNGAGCPWSRPVRCSVRQSSPIPMEVRADDALRESLVPAASDVALHAERLAPDTPVGGRIPLQRPATAWVRSALAVVERGRIAVVDYASTTTELARRPWTEWVRTYRGHGPGRGPLEDLGEQ